MSEGSVRGQWCWCGGCSSAEAVVCEALGDRRLIGFKLNVAKKSACCWFGHQDPSYKKANPYRLAFLLWRTQGPRATEMPEASLPWAAHRRNSSCLTHALVDPVPRLLREPTVVVPSNSDDQHIVIAVEVRFQAGVDAGSVEVGIDKPSRSQVVPPAAAAFDRAVKAVIVTSGFAQVIVDCIYHFNGP